MGKMLIKYRTNLILGVGILGVLWLFVMLYSGVKEGYSSIFFSAMLIAPLILILIPKNTVKIDLTFAIVITLLIILSAFVFWEYKDSTLPYANFIPQSSEDGKHWFSFENQLEIDLMFKFALFFTAISLLIRLAFSKYSSSSKKTIAAITIMQFTLFAVSAVILSFARNHINGGGFLHVDYTVSLPIYLLIAIILISGILLFDIIFLNLLKTSKTRKIILMFYYLMIYAVRLFVSVFIVSGVFNFYLINSDYVLSTYLHNIIFYIFPMISPIAIGIILFVRYKLFSRQIIIDKSSEMETLAE
jgi:hypothetical protein